ncbi:hypothetical protein J7E88_33280 [Streptomyces sp. ISL-10]|uniref:hypothetical protein n=1 Tax=Streptomyces sp. ISL-10 TaxID=2819172 RepID=UPI001BEC167B|nr:hypothetical protein [Streptomyces sp. ISL-10]MBT2370013.1 hypothetical protein [Streptomyces sp. ISL-10]
MTTAQHLAAIDLLRGRAFPARRGRSELGDSGPGYHLARLAPAVESPHACGIREEDAAEQCRAECEALADALSTRWGPPQRVSLWSVSMRSVAGEAIADPWDELSHLTDDVHLWHVDGHWIAVGVACADELRWELLAVITETDPP